MNIVLNKISWSLLWVSRVCLVLFITSCRKTEPTACLHMESGDVYEFQLLQFENCSEDYVTTEFDFGDGNSSNISNPTHSYSQSGEYNIRMKVLDHEGNYNETSFPIKVWGAEIDSIKTIFPESLTSNAHHRGQRVNGNYVSHYDAEFGMGVDGIHFPVPIRIEKEVILDLFLNVTGGMSYESTFEFKLSDTDLTGATNLLEGFDEETGLGVEIYYHVTLDRP